MAFAMEPSRSGRKILRARRWMSCEKYVAFGGVKKPRDGSDDRDGVEMVKEPIASRAALDESRPSLTLVPPEDRLSFVAIQSEVTELPLRVGRKRVVFRQVEGSAICTWPVHRCGK
jgi:hypothetical protein